MSFSTEKTHFIIGHATSKPNKYLDMGMLEVKADPDGYYQYHSSCFGLSSISEDNSVDKLSLVKLFLACSTVSRLVFTHFGDQQEVH